ncbi:hypothetical protein CS022_24365 [Veronia nyctiphanis]|uniref:Uncharacterized protein n=1 Tax=Veronia nyctiphanis TaxID=1278244 RepID=A0A4Q0YCA8_9GAMM|nr:hypothetical protein CS022_24365 [Veronia nyctiphanis]
MKKKGCSIFDQKPAHYLKTDCLETCDSTYCPWEFEFPEPLLLRSNYSRKPVYYEFGKVITRPWFAGFGTYFSYLLYLRLFYKFGIKGALALLQWTLNLES